VTADPETVAVLGAGGIMGLPIARNLARAGLQVRAWNRSREKAQTLTDDGVTVCETPAEAAQGSSAILTMLADSDAVIATMSGDSGALEETAGSALWLQMSTVGEGGTKRCAQLAHQRGITFVDAPVLGTKQPAEQGKLVILASGPEQARDRLDAIFDPIGSKTLWLGDAGAGTRLKVAINSWVLTVTEGTAEMIALAEGLGLDPTLIFQALEGGTLDLPYLRIKGQAILERKFEPSFSLALAAKDAALIEESAERHDLDLPLFHTIRERLAEGARENGEKDMCATYLTSAPARATA
jgi:3-hydroxyisobutyrate dehydrogenase